MTNAVEQRLELSRLRIGLSRVTGKLAPLRSLRGSRDAALFVRVMALGATVPVVVRLPLPRQAALLDRAPLRTRRRPPSTGDAERAKRCVEAAQNVGSPLVKRGCLTRGILLYWLVGRADDDVELCFGLGVVDGRPSGHCWLTRGGEPYLERVDPSERFEVIYRIPVPPTD